MTAQEYAATVSTTMRFHGDIFIGAEEFNSITAAVVAAFEAGQREGAEAVARLEASRDSWQELYRQQFARTAELERKAEAELTRIREENERCSTRLVAAKKALDVHRQLLHSMAMEDLALVTRLREMEQEFRSTAMVAGQASVEEPDLVRASADVKFADYCTRWADEIAALLSIQEAPPPQAEDDARAVGVPEGAHGDLPRRTKG